MGGRFGRSGDDALAALADVELIGQARQARAAGHGDRGERALAVLAAGYRSIVRGRLALSLGKAVDDSLVDAVIADAIIEALSTGAPGGFRRQVNGATDAHVSAWRGDDRSRTPVTQDDRRNPAVTEDTVPLLLAMFATEFDLGADPDPTEFTERAGEGAGELSELIDAHLRGSARRTASVDENSRALAQRLYDKSA